MPKIERTVTVLQPLEKVWEYLTDFTTTEQWDPGTVSTQRITGTGGPGTVYENVSRVLGRDVEIEYTVTELQPRSLFQLSGTTAAMNLLDTMRFEQTPDGVAVTYTAQFQPRGLMKLIEPLMPLGLKKLGDDAAKSLKATLERL